MIVLTSPHYYQSDVSAFCNPGRLAQKGPGRNRCPILRLRGRFVRQQGEGLLAGYVRAYFQHIEPAW